MTNYVAVNFAISVYFCDNMEISPLYTDRYRLEEAFSVVIPRLPLLLMRYTNMVAFDRHNFLSTGEAFFIIIQTQAKTNAQSQLHF